MHDRQNPDPVSLVKGDDAIARILINRPEQRNALSLEALRCLRNIFEGLHADRGLKCAILTGAGDRSFAAGGDLKELAHYRTDEQAAEVSQCGRRALDAIRHSPVPVYAAINGHALGGGAELAVACDFRIAKASASIGFLQGKLNITTAWGGAADLIGLVGADRALEMLLTSRIMSMSAARETGLIDVVVPEGADLLESVLAHASHFLSKPAHVIQAFAGISHAGKASLRTNLEPIEFQSFVTTWVHQAHWTAAEQSILDARANRGKS
jgi:enoyl-CoA hydratase/carnithine racemase